MPVETVPETNHIDTSAARPGDTLGYATIRAFSSFDKPRQRRELAPTVSIPGASPPATPGLCPHGNPTWPSRSIRPTEDGSQRRNLAPMKGWCPRTVYRSDAEFYVDRMDRFANKTLFLREGDAFGGAPWHPAQAKFGVAPGARGGSVMLHMTTSASAAAMGGSSGTPSEAPPSGSGRFARLAHRRLTSSTRRAAYVRDRRRASVSLAPRNGSGNPPNFDSSARPSESLMSTSATEKGWRRRRTPPLERVASEAEQLKPAAPGDEDPLSVRPSVVESL